MDSDSQSTETSGGLFQKISDWRVGRQVKDCMDAISYDYYERIVSARDVLFIARVEIKAAEKLGEIAKKHPKYDWAGVVNALIKELGEEQHEVGSYDSIKRLNFARAIGCIGANEEQIKAIIRLAEGSQEQNPNRFALAALGHLAGYHPEYDLSVAVPALINAFDDTGRAFEKDAVKTLGNIGRNEKSRDATIAQLMDVLENGKPAVWNHAAVALGEAIVNEKGRSDAVIAVLTKAFGNEDTRGDAARAICVFGLSYSKSCDRKNLEALIAQVKFVDPKQRILVRSLREMLDKMPLEGAPMPTTGRAVFGNCKPPVAEAGKVAPQKLKRQ